MSTSLTSPILPAVRRSERVCRLWAAVVVWLAGVAIAGADDGLGIRKVDPSSGYTIPEPVAEMRLGDIYSHFDAQLNRRVWSHWLGAGRWGIALGAGTCQPAARFDIRLPPKEALDLLRKWDPKLADDTVREGTEVFLKLYADQRWRVTRTATAMIFDPETGYRFEQQFNHYIPVRHLHGYAWRPDGERYAPAP